MDELIDTFAASLKEQIRHLKMGHAKELKETIARLKQEHELELSNRQTVGLKMSLIKEYDDHLHRLETELSIVKRRLEQYQKGQVQPSIQHPLPQEETLKKEQQPPQQQQEDEPSSQEGDLHEQPTPISPAVQSKEVVAARKKIKYKGEIYHYDPINLLVYRSSENLEAIGEKKEKQIVFYS